MIYVCPKLDRPVTVVCNGCTCGMIIEKNNGEPDRSQMTDYKIRDINSEGDTPAVRLRQFNNGTVQLHQFNKYQNRGGKTIYLTREMFLNLRNVMIENMD